MFYFIRNLMYHLYKNLLALVKTGTLVSWDMSETDIPIIKIVN